MHTETARGARGSQWTDEAGHAVLNCTVLLFCKQTSRSHPPLVAMSLKGIPTTSLQPSRRYSCLRYKHGTSQLSMHAVAHERGAACTLRTVGQARTRWTAETDSTQGNWGGTVGMADDRRARRAAPAAHSLRLFKV